MIEKIDQFSMTTGLSVESIKQLRDALDKLRNEQISRNPFPSVFGGVKRFITEETPAAKAAEGVKEYPAL